jgi:hypothetical protein
MASMYKPRGSRKQAKSLGEDFQNLTRPSPRNRSPGNQILAGAPAGRVQSTALVPSTGSSKARKSAVGN